MGLRTLVLVLGVLAGSTTGALEKPRDLNDQVESLRDRIGVPALAVVLLDDKGATARGIAGTFGVDDDTPVTFDSRFHLGSLSKAMTATVAASLVEDQIISWDTTLEEVCPERAATIPEGYRSVTLRQLLTHRGGLPDDRNRIPIYFKLWMHSGSPTEARHDAVESSYKLDGLIEPNKSMVYSNSGYMLAGHMLEEAADESFETLIRKRLFDPLNMTHAGFGEPVETHGETEPRGHIRNDDGVRVAPRGPIGALPLAMNPAGGVHCSVDELSAFVQANLAGLRGQDGIITATSFQTLHADPESDGYALGWALDTRNPDAIMSNHAGSNKRWFAIMAVDPANNRAFVAVMNAVPDQAAGINLFREIGRWAEPTQLVAPDSSP